MLMKKGFNMKQLIPSQKVESNNVSFPLEGDRCKNYCIVITMELFGCTIAQVSHETGLTVDEIQEICNSEDYHFIKQNLINSIRRLDQDTLSGRILQEASEAFNRMTELSRDAKKEDVKLEANKDILDRAMLTNTVNQQADELRITFVKRR